METEPQEVDPPKRKRRWYQFSLRALLIMTTLVCIAGGWLGNQVRAVRERYALTHRAGVDSDVGAGDRYRLPLIRRLLGDEFYIGVLIDRLLSEEFDRYKTAFPEATILQRESSDFYELYHRLHPQTAKQTGS